jgi:molecular chaperone GrpE
MEEEKDRRTAGELPTDRPARDEDEGTASNSEASTGVEELVSAEEQLLREKQQLVREKQELYERLLRKQAELDNFRKRMQREKEDFLQHATTDLVRALLPTLDAFERALKHRDANIPEQFYRGMELIHKQLSDVLARAGLAPVETAGQMFDPHLHQAVETVESPGHRDQEIVEELQRGYKLKHRLLRPAIVKVAVGGHDSGRRGGDGSGGPQKGARASEAAEN